MPAVKLCDGSGCQRRTFSFVREVARVVPAATSQIHRRHIRARLYWENKLIVRFADDFVRSSFHCIFKKLSLKVFIQKKTFERCWTASGQSGTFKVTVFLLSNKLSRKFNGTDISHEYMKRTQVIFSSANPCIQTLFIRSISLKAYIVRRSDSSLKLETTYICHMKRSEGPLSFFVSKVNSLYSGHCRDLELINS